MANNERQDEKDEPIWKLCARLDEAFRSLQFEDSINNVHQWAHSAFWITAEIRGQVRRLRAEPGAAPRDKKEQDVDTRVGVVPSDRPLGSTASSHEVK